MNIILLKDRINKAISNNQTILNIFNIFIYDYFRELTKITDNKFFDEIYLCDYSD